MNKKKVGIIVGIVIVALIGGVILAKTRRNSDVVSERETINITHRAGETEVPKNPKKVVVLDYASLDILDFMGIDSVIGTPKSSLPSYLDEYKNEKYVDLGGLKEFSLETINEIKPDLIIIEGRQKEFYDELSAIAPTIQLGTDNTSYLGSLKTNVSTLGEIYGKEDIATSTIVEIEDRITSVGEKVKNEKLNALAVMVNEGTMGAYGNGSRFEILFSGFGFTAADSNIEVSNHGQNVSYEYLLAKNPNYLFVIDKAAGTTGSTDYSAAKGLIENELVKTTDTYKDGNIVYLNSQAWYVGGAGLQAADLMISDIEKIMK